MDKREETTVSMHYWTLCIWYLVSWVIIWAGPRYTMLTKSAFKIAQHSYFLQDAILASRVQNCIRHTSAVCQRPRLQRKRSADKMTVSGLIISFFILLFMFSRNIFAIFVFSLSKILNSIIINWNFKDPLHRTISSVCFKFERNETIWTDSAPRSVLAWPDVLSRNRSWT